MVPVVAGVAVLAVVVALVASRFLGQGLPPEIELPGPEAIDTAGTPPPPGFGDQPLWTRDGLFSVALGGGLAVVEYAESLRTGMVVLDARTGETRWALGRRAVIAGGTTMRATGIGPYPTAEGTVIIGTRLLEEESPSGVTALDGGRRVWTYEPGGGVSFGGAVGDGFTALNVTGPGREPGVVVLGNHDGEPVWRLDGHRMDNLAGGVVLARPNGSAAIGGFDGRTGRKLWEHPEYTSAELAYADAAVVVVKAAVGAETPVHRLLDALSGAEIARLDDQVNTLLGACASDASALVCDLVNRGVEEDRRLLSYAGGHVRMSARAPADTGATRSVWRGRVLLAESTVDIAGVELRPGLPGPLLAEGGGFVAFRTGGDDGDITVSVHAATG
ncbi:hypothetical protein Afil01_57780 [Actinorhabdospora filicis]|uniref:Pyrrolo-quinoline quinone repeat domain-containing protein n=1 Tax=Actinorhabdospora filicis TaxID=1785913 RepID=A0A9W6SRF3_9ACTN|nr:hypothetical protein Afil01_57780 [Actinorhabdospora filicis]